MPINVYETDVLVIGGGLAAVRAAIEAASEGANVTLVAKAPLGKSGASAMAGGGMSAAIDEVHDSPAVHFADTIAVGRGLTDPELAQIMTLEAPARARDLIAYGVVFIQHDGEVRLGHVPGHSKHRQLHSVSGGVAYMLPLRRKALSYPNLTLQEDVMAVKLLVDDGRAVGALCYDVKTGELVAFLAGATILATGGYQDLYPLSSASVDMTGDGYAMAYQAGAELVDLEMLLYYPTALLWPLAARGALILYENALREDGVGARIVNAAGEDMLETYNPLPVRDVLSRRIFEEVRKGKGTERGGVYIDTSLSSRPVEKRAELLERHDPFFSFLTSIGLEVANSRLEVAPAAHTVLGGVRINARCQTTVPGLFAAGEVAGNVHGANRLGGNALAETQVFGQRAGLFGARFAREASWPKVSDAQVADAAREILAMAESKEDALDPVAIKHNIRQTMFECAGPTRDEQGLSDGIRRIEAIIASDLPRMRVSARPAEFNYPLQEALEARGMAATALLICHAARERRESRGHHFRSDFPRPDDSRPPHHTSLRRQDSGLVADVYPVS